MFVNKHMLDVIVVMISFVCYVDHLLRHDFSGLNTSGFSAQKKKREKLVSKEKEKCGRRAWPNGLALHVKHHLIRRRKGIDFANRGFNTFSYHRKGKIEIERLRSRLKKKETKKRHKEKKKLIFCLYKIWPPVKQRAPH